MRRPLFWPCTLALLVVGSGVASTGAAAARNMSPARAAYAAHVGEILRGRVSLEVSSRFFRMESPRMGPGYARVLFMIDSSGQVTNVRVVNASSDAHALKAEKILFGLRLPPPPEGGFAARQDFNFQ
ncbi:MAG: energy transducer TonB [Methylocystis sp.]|uniref:energy transducer TonB family protein n=1 Tax=Methylocystis sp. TaxID=1911079 RepID=UPI003D13CD8F